MKIVIALTFFGILLSLGAAGAYMLRGTDKDNAKANVAKALTVRIGISVALFILILVLWFVGAIQPTGIVPGG